MQGQEEAQGAGMEGWQVEQVAGAYTGEWQTSLLVIRGPGCAFEDCVQQGSANLQHCARCNVMCYCSCEHQMADWRIRHKGKCDDLQDQALACGFVDLIMGVVPELEVPQGV
jgi:hypothetical protein